MPGRSCGVGQKALKLLLFLLLLALPAHALPARLDIQVQAQVDENRLIVQEELQWTLPLEVTELTLEGQRVPLLLELTELPTLEVTATMGTLTTTQLGQNLMLHGMLHAGHPAGLVVRYALPFHADLLQLHLLAGTDNCWFTLAIAAHPPVRLRLDVDKPARLSRFEEGRERLVGLSLARPLAPGQTLHVLLRDLPVAATLPGRTLAWLAGGAILLGLTGLLARRK